MGQSPGWTAVRLSGCLAVLVALVWMLLSAKAAYAAVTWVIALLVGGLLLQDKNDLKEHLQQLARQCQWLILWLDCDREGENISFEVGEQHLHQNTRLRQQQVP